MHLRSEQVQVQRSEDVVQDLTRPGDLREVDREGQLLGALGAVPGGVGDGAGDVPTA